MSASVTSIEPLICQAIRAGRRLQFDYDGLPRLVEPYCHGLTTSGNQALRAVQVGGVGKYGFGKLWTVSKMMNVQMLEPFTARDPNYNPQDSAMQTIHCALK